MFGLTSSDFVCFFFLLSGVGEAGRKPADSHEVSEVSGPSHRIGLSGANKTMLHLLKKAKVQLIKIDQQKQLKLSQVRRSNQKCGEEEEKFVRKTFANCKNDSSA